MFYHGAHIKKLETYFALLYFWNFSVCCLEEEKMLTLKNVQNRKESKSPDFLYVLAMQCTVTFDN